METLVFIVVVLFVLGAILTALAFYRGWFRLAAVRADDKDPFILMRKKVDVRKVENSRPASPEDERLGQKNIVPPGTP